LRQVLVGQRVEIDGWPLRLTAGLARLGLARLALARLVRIVADLGPRGRAIVTARAREHERQRGEGRGFTGHHRSLRPIAEAHPNTVDLGQIGARLLEPATKVEVEVAE